MKIKVKVKLDDHYSPLGSFEGTRAIVKFKDPSKIRKTKLKVYLCCYRYKEETYEEFLNRCEESIKLNNVKAHVEYAVREYFEDKNINISNKNKFKKLQKTIKKLQKTMKKFNNEKIEFEVEI